MALHLCEPLPAQEYLVLASALSERPHSSLRVFDIASPSFRDLAFLEYFPTVEQLQLETGCALDPALFRRLNPDLQALRVQARVHLSSSEQLHSFANLRTLQITGRLKTYEGLSNLRSLDEVGLANANDDAVEELGGFEALSILNLVGRSVSSLEPLEGRTIGSLSVANLGGLLT